MKVLIISHNIISRTNNMGKTLLSYFDGWGADKLCQLFLQSEAPTTDCCGAYYRVNDVDIVKSLIFHKKPGVALREQDYSADGELRIDSEVAAEMYKVGKKRKPWMYVARNAIWAMNTWKTDNLDKWLEECNPDVIFFASGDYAFSYKIVEYVSKKLNIPIVTAVFDDYYFYRAKSYSPLARLNTYVFRKTFSRIMKQSASALYVHPAMKEKYDEEFRVKSEVVYTSAEVVCVPEKENEVINISYFGGLDLKRYESLIEIGMTLRRISPDGQIYLDVYSGEKQTDILEKMTIENGIRFMGSVGAQEVKERQKQSNILVLAESMSPEILERIRYSLSTKAAEYLASGRCILAYGPREAGVISYLIENDAACVVTNQRELEEKLSKLITSPALRKQYAKNQLELAAKNHRADQNREIIRKLICTAVENT